MNYRFLSRHVVALIASSCTLFACGGSVPLGIEGAGGDSSGNGSSGNGSSSNGGRGGTSNASGSEGSGPASCTPCSVGVGVASDIDGNGTDLFCCRETPNFCFANRTDGSLWTLQGVRLATCPGGLTTGPSGSGTSTFTTGSPPPQAGTSTFNVTTATVEQGTSRGVGTATSTLGSSAFTATLGITGQATSTY